MNNRKMLKRTGAFIGAAAMVMAIAGNANARMSINGLALQGIALQGAHWNGLSFNGAFLNSADMKNVQISTESTNQLSHKISAKNGQLVIEFANNTKTSLN